MKKVKKMANNILEFLLDPTVIPVEKRLYFRPEEKLQNDYYMNAKKDAQVAYGNQAHNSDMYPIRNRSLKQREVESMDKRTLVASFDILAQNFDEGDPISKELKVMADVILKMGDEELEGRTAKRKLNDWMKLMQKVRNDPENKGKSIADLAAIAKKLYKPKEKKAEECTDEDKKEKTEKEASYFWSKEASEAVRKALVSDVLGMDKKDEEDEESDAEASTKACPKCGEEECKCPAKKAVSEDAEAGAVEQETKKPVKETKEPVKPVEKEAIESPVQEQQEEHEKGETPEEEKKEKEETPVKEAKEEKKPEAEKDSKEKVVDTTVLKAAKGFYEDIEMDTPILTAEDLGELSKDEELRLSQLFIK